MTLMIMTNREVAVMNRDVFERLMKYEAQPAHWWACVSHATRAVAKNKSAYF